MIKHLLRVMLLTLLALTVMPVSMALEISSPEEGISIEAANGKLVDVRKKLEISATEDKELHASIIAIKSLKEKALTCADAGQEKIKKINALLNDSNVGDAIKQNAIDYDYLNMKKESVAKRAASCRVFAFKAQELLDSYADNVRLHAPAKTLTMSRPIFSSISDVVTSQFSVGTDRFYQNSGIGAFSMLRSFIALFCLVVALVAAKLIHSFCGGYVGRHKDVTSLTRHFSKIVRRYVFFMLPLLFATIFSYCIYSNEKTFPIIADFVYAFFVFTVVTAIADYIFHFPPVKESAISREMLQQRIFKKFMFVAGLILVGYIGAVFLRGVELSQGLVDLITICYMTALILGMLWFCLGIFRLPFFSNKKYLMTDFVLKILVSTLFVSLIIFEWLGYHDVSSYFLKGTLLSSVIFILAWGAVQVVGHACFVLQDKHHYLSQILRRATNINPDRDFVEVYMLKFAFYIVFTFVLVLALMQIWGASLYDLDQVKTGFLSGFRILDVTLIPVQIIAGLVTFSMINLFGRVYAVRIARKDLLHTQIGTQVAIFSVINYIFFTVAAIVGLLVAGVNFTGLAIIAGALSVGIGFGLQHIVNNFLCGLILLIQKPVKPGDRIVIDGTEGVVRKIRLISTQIKTQSREDVIIPNADFISHPIINYMFRDSFWRVKSCVGVKYGSDTELVKKLLLEVASQHPDVLQEEPNAPSVIFSEFGDSALHFELWSIIRDVNKKYCVQSDLNFAIDNLFRAHNIVIPYPQRDVHVKDPTDVKTE